MGIGNKHSAIARINQELMRQNAKMQLVAYSKSLNPQIKS